MEGRRPITRGRAWPAVALALAATAPAACSSFSGQGTTALSFMRQARENSDPNARYKAYVKLAAPGAYDNDAQRADAVRVMAAALESNREPVATRAVICQGLGTLRRPEGRDAIVKATEDSEPLIRAEAIRALGKIGQPEDATRLVRAMTADTQPECRIAAIDALGDLKPLDPRIREALVDGMDHDEPSIRYACLQALRSITGRDLGTDVGPWRKLVEAEAKAQLAQARAKDAPRPDPEASPAGFFGKRWSKGEPATNPKPDPTARPLAQPDLRSVPSLPATKAE